MKLTYKFTIEIKPEYFAKMAIPIVSKAETRKAIKGELLQCAAAIVHGEFGGELKSWENYFFYSLWRQGIIKQTKLAIEIFGEYK